MARLACHHFQVGQLIQELETSRALRGYSRLAVFGQALCCDSLGFSSCLRPLAQIDSRVCDRVRTAYTAAYYPYSRTKRYFLFKR